MINRHFDELDEAVRVARSAVTTQHAADADRLSRVLHERWYLGLTSQQTGVPAASARPWQAWGRHWRPRLDDGEVDLVRLHLSVAPQTALPVLATVTGRAHTWEHPWRAPRRRSRARWRTAAPGGATLVEDGRSWPAPAPPAVGRRSLSDSPAAVAPRRARCRLVAQAVLGSSREQVSRAIEALAAAGVDPERPYLERSTSWDRPWRAA